MQRASERRRRFLIRRRCRRGSAPREPRAPAAAAAESVCAVRRRGACIKN